MFTAIWEFRVKADCTQSFEEHYGPNGTWARLFSLDRAFRTCTLLRKDDGRYLTIDRWDDVESYDRFRSAYAAVYEAVDSVCEAFTTTERHVASIRPPRAEEFDGLISLFRDVAAEGKWIGTEPGFDERKFRETWRRMLEGSEGALFVAVDQERIVGYAGVHPHHEYGHVIGMLVDSNYRGCGIGEALLDCAEDWATGQGLPDLSLLVFPHNEAAIALYRKHGFEQREYYPKDVTRKTGEVWDSILMTKVFGAHRNSET